MLLREMWRYCNADTAGSAGLAGSSTNTLSCFYQRMSRWEHKIEATCFDENLKHNKRLITSQWRACAVAHPAPGSVEIDADFVFWSAARVNRVSALSQDVFFVHVSMLNASPMPIFTDLSIEGLLSSHMDKFRGDLLNTLNHFDSYSHAISKKHRTIAPHQFIPAYLRTSQFT